MRLQLKLIDSLRAPERRELLILEVPIRAGHDPLGGSTFPARKPGEFYAVHADMPSVIVLEQAFERVTGYRCHVEEVKDEVIQGADPGDEAK